MSLKNGGIMWDSEVLKILFTIVCTIATTLLTIGKWFRKTIDVLNIRIDQLSAAITALDKSVAVQNAILEGHIEKEK